MRAWSRAIGRTVVAWRLLVPTFVLPLLFVTTVTVIDEFVPLPSLALVALQLLTVTASVTIGGRASGAIAIAAAVAASSRLGPLDLVTLAGAGIGIVVTVAPLRDSLARAEEVRRTSADAREWLRQIVDRLPHPIVVWDREGHATFANEAALSLVGAPEPELLDVARVLRGHDVRSRELAITDVKGRERMIVVAATPLRTGRTITGAVATFLDVTDMKSLEQERADFYAMLGHEIKTPLTAVYGQAQMLRRLLDRDASAEQLRTSVEQLDGAIARMRELTSEVGDLTTMRAGRFVLTPREIDMRVLVQSALDRNVARSDRHTIEVVQPRDALVASCDEFRVEQVLDNLIANAIQYSPEGGSVRLELSRDGTQGLIRIVDEGMGVPSGERARIFEAFYRASNARSRRGTGLGLAISRDILRRSGGDLWLERTGPDGSTFTLTIPLVRSEPVRPPLGLER